MWPYFLWAEKPPLCESVCMCIGECVYVCVCGVGGVMLKQILILWVWDVAQDPAFLANFQTPRKVGQSIFTKGQESSVTLKDY